MGRPFTPGTGVNRQVLLLLRRKPGLWPGTAARLLGLDGGVVRDAIARLEGYGFVVAHLDQEGHRCCYVTEAGLRVLAQRGRKTALASQ